MWRRKNQTINYYYDKVCSREFSPKLYVQFSIKIRMCIYTSRAAFVCDGQGKTNEKGFHDGMW